MRLILGVALFAVMGLGATAADIDAKKLVGKWQSATKNNAKIVLEFTKDGKLHVAVDAKGKDLKFDGTYKLEADKLSIKVNFGGKEAERSMKVKKLTDDELVTEDEKGKSETLKRVK